MFTWAPADAHPNSTDVVALNIADYNSCKRYDYDFGGSPRPHDRAERMDVEAGAGSRDFDADDADAEDAIDKFFQDYLDGVLEAASVV